MVYTTEDVIKVIKSNAVYTEIPADSEIIVSSSGKVRTSGSVKIDGVRYTVENYIVTNVEVID